MKLLQPSVLLLLPIMICYYSCAPVSQYASDKDIATPVPTKRLAKIHGKSYKTLVEGRAVYDSHCIKCHENRLPGTSDLPEWHAKIHTMAERATLSPQQEASLQSYLEIFSDR